MSQRAEARTTGATIEIGQGAAETEGAPRAPELWQERSCGCLDCGKEAGLPTNGGRCPECGGLVLRRAVRQGSELAEQQDVGLARSQERAWQAQEARRAVGVAATRLRLAQASRPSAV